MKQNIAKITDAYSHYVGNKSSDDRVILSERSALDPNMMEDQKKILRDHFLEPFENNEELLSFYHEADLTLNEVYSIVSSFFDKKENLHDISKSLARVLLKRTLFPTIKSGDFHVVHFEDLVVDGEVISAIGLFKSEVKNNFIRSTNAKNGIMLSIDEGVLKSKIDKGCVIFNTQKEEGYLVKSIDKTNKGIEAAFWPSTFLGIKPTQSEYLNTSSFLSLTKDFVKDQMSKDNPIDKADQADILNKSMSFFKENKEFDHDQFMNTVFEKPDLIDSFRRFETQFQEENEVQIPNSFEISEQAVKKKSRVFKSVLKLDKNFHIYIHGNRNLIEKGVDPESGKKFYKIYYDHED
ncbi:MAG: nucleoid-associated protein [Cyclobacteriaceae bacterium]|tara:strand:+ start:1220 stop:2272 length:1053 start_codon:yes stop_codon:yes gene_type:complete